jgi:hypothetical protein
MEVIRGFHKNLLRKPEFRENRLSEIDTLYKGVQKFLPVSLIVLSGYKFNLLSNTSKQYCWVYVGFVKIGLLKDVLQKGVN